MTLSAAEFLRRFVQHILPRGFVRIRQYGFLASACRTARLVLARRLLRTPPPTAEAPEASSAAVWHCPQCGTTMTVGPFWSFARLIRAAPRLDTS
jgi:hypothetical protein